MLFIGKKENVNDNNPYHSGYIAPKGWKPKNPD